MIPEPGRQKPRPYCKSSQYERHTSKKLTANLGCCGGKEVVNLPVQILRAGQILHTANLRLNQVVTVDGGGDSGGVHASGHELKDGHLGWENDVKNFSYASSLAMTYLSGGILAGNSLSKEGEALDEVQ